MSGVFQTIDPPTPYSTQRVWPPPAPKAGGTHSPGGEGVGVNILEDARHWIGLLQESLYGQSTRTPKHPGPGGPTGVQHKP